MNRYNREMFIGAKVTLDPKSKYWKFNTPDNPRSIAGRVVDGVSDYAFFIKWSNGESNGYRQGDLKVLGEIVDG